MKDGILMNRREFLKKTGALLAFAALGNSLANLAKIKAEAEKSSGLAYALEQSLKGERYIPTTCCVCVNFCGIKVKVVDGVARAIYPDENRAEYFNWGNCPKGLSGIFDMYNPYRIKAPLKRTNPDKSPDADPKFVEISWEEAFDEIAKRLKKIMEEDPRKFVFQWGHGKYLMGDKVTKAFLKAVGSPNNVHRTTTCEAARHIADEITWGYHGILPDLEYCNYLINMGANYFEAEQWARWLDHACLDAMERGMKLVVVEPRLSNLGAKADEWIPIKPGTDVVFLLAMARVLIENGYVDKDFLITYTNAPFLVGEDGKFLKKKVGFGKEAKKVPLVWDKKKNRAVTYDEAEEIELDAEVTVDGKKYKTAFRIWKEEVFEIDLKEAEEITGVPAETIRKIAIEFGENARIGSTINIEGKELRYRPVAIHSFRGLSAKEYGVQNWRAALLVQMLVGCLDAVGGLILHGVYKKPKYMGPSKCEYPPQRIDLAESVFFPHATHNVAQQPMLTALEPEKYGLEYKPEMQMFYATNRPMSTSDIKKQFEGLKKTFNVSISIALDEVAQMCDIVLPNKSYLESWHFSPTRWTPGTKHTAIRQPVANPYNLKYQDWDILWEIAKRLGNGFMEKYIENLNKKWGLKKVKFEKGREYKAKDYVRVIWEDKTGKPFEYAIKHAFVGKKLNVEKRYLSGVEKKFKGKGKPKMNFYAENLVVSKEKVKEIIKKNPKVAAVFKEWYEEDNMDRLLDIKLSPIPIKEHAFPTPHKKAKDYPFYLITYKRMYRNQASQDALYPVLREVAHDSNYNYVLINTKTARELEIKDNDEVWIESRIGKVKAIAKLTEGIRPDTVAVSYHYGRFARAFPEYAKKGTAINWVLELHPDMISGMNSFNDTKVKVYKA